MDTIFSQLLNSTVDVSGDSCLCFIKQVGSSLEMMSMSLTRLLINFIQNLVCVQLGTKWSVLRITLG